MNHDNERLDLIYPDELRTFVKNRLKNKWILIAGDIDAFYNIENMVYPPKTELNRFFELFIHPSFSGCGAFALCKKTKELKNILNIFQILNKLLQYGFIKRYQMKTEKSLFFLNNVIQKKMLMLMK